MHDICDIWRMTIDASASRWVPTTGTFGARLALLRHEMRWNLKEAALACGVPQASWREWELKGRDPRGLQEIVAKIAERTGVDDYWLLTGKYLPSGGPSGGAPSAPIPDGGSPLSDSNRRALAYLVPRRPALIAEPVYVAAAAA